MEILYIRTVTRSLNRFIPRLFGVKCCSFYRSSVIYSFKGLLCRNQGQKWKMIFIMSRSFSVKIRKFFSPSALICGGPQGSVLGPVLVLTPAPWFYLSETQ